MFDKQKIWENKLYYDKAHEASLDLSHPGLQLIKEYGEKAKSILEVGCGEGTKLYKLFSKKNYRIGIDISKIAIKRAKKNYPKIWFKVADAEKLPFKSKEFDLVFSAFLLEHLQNPEKALLEIIRVAKKYLILVAPNFGAPNRASPCFKGSRIKKLIKGVFRDYQWTIKPPENLYWSKVGPIATKKDYQIDWDTTVEPYLLSLKAFLLKNNLKIIHCSSLWQVKQEKEPIWQKLFKILGRSKIYPFIYWGPHLVVMAEKINL